MQMVVSGASVHVLMKPIMPIEVTTVWDFTIHRDKKIVLCSIVHFDAYGQEIPGYRSPVWLALPDARFRPRQDIERPSIYNSWPVWGREWFDRSIARARI